MKLNELANLVNGYAFKSRNYVDSGLRIIRITNVQDGFLSDDNPCFYPAEFEKKLKDAKLNENDLLMSLTGNVGRVAILSKEYLPAGLNQRVECIRPFSAKDTEYLYYYFRSQKFKNQVTSATTGLAQQNLSVKWLENHDIPYFDQNKRTKIVKELKNLDKAIKAKEEQLKALNELSQSRFIEMFGDPITNAKNFPMNELRELGILERGRSKHRPRNDSILLNGPYPLIQTGDIANADTYITNYKSTYSDIGLKQSKMWDAGTLCITIAANIAETAILKFNACFPDSVVGFIPNQDVHILFIHYWFRFLQPILEENAPALAQKNLNLNTLSRVNVITPPLPLQNQFAEFVQQVEKAKGIVKIQIKDLQELLALKMDEYFK